MHPRELPVAGSAVINTADDASETTEKCIRQQDL